MHLWWRRCVFISLAITLLIGLAPSAYAIDPTPTPESVLPTEPATMTPTVPLPTEQATATATTVPTQTAVATVAPVLSPTAQTPATPTSAAALVPQQAGTLQLEITKTLIGSDVVQVGSYLTFTVRIRNTGSVTVTTLPLIDEYDPAVLQPTLDRFQPAPDLVASGRLDWSDLTDLPGFGDLPPGSEFLVTTVFRAIGISDTVINRARVEAAIGSGGLGGGSGGSSSSGTVQGGRVIIEKALIADVIRADAPTVSFAITVRNTGAADLVQVPVEDVFDPAYLRFIAAQPAPDRADPTTGVLGWDNILAGLGLSRLQPGQVVTATTTFAVLAPIDNLVVNRISGSNVRDEFGNAVQAPRQADVRIRIVGVADTRPTAQPAERRRTATPTPEATPAATATVAGDLAATLVPTATQPEQSVADQALASAAPTPAGPATLPRTGAGADRQWVFWLASMLLLLGTAGLWRTRPGRD